ncbi:MAG: O-Antigen ligase [candidate division WS2 bacterium ADurb.Bin280]|uniref:O-Antigen ligase n=1 Tax=candidate division WS2 bacterium ADurb.Bin280 TaxID=1852829 RepID=A0A1V5SD49_9BACT|nr:MAG: O-Antigen ligase [candidate division WS2 bacterium ADurb.Bin280]
MKNRGLIVFYFIAIILAFVSGIALSYLKFPIGLVFILSLTLAIGLIPLIVKKPVIAPILIGFFLPFERVPTLEIGGATLKINHILILISLIACLISFFAERSKIPRDKVRFSVIYFLLFLLISLTVAINFSRAIQVYVFMLLMGALYMIVTLSVKTKEDIKKVLTAILWGALFSGFFGLMQFAGDAVGLPNEITLLKEGYDQSTFGFARIQAFSQEPLYFANYLFIPILLIFVLNLKGLIGGVFNKTLSYILLGALLIDFILAVSRGAYLGAAAVLLILLVSQRKAILNFKVVAISLAMIFIVGFGAYFALSKGESRAIDEFVAHVAVEDRDEGESVVLRLSTASLAWELFTHNPVLGVGLGNFGPVIQGDPDEPPEEDGWSIVNNEYLEILSEGGLVVFLSFVALIISLITNSVSALRKSKETFLKATVFALLVSFIGILVQYTTFSTLYIIHIWYLIALLSASSRVALEGVNE